MQHPQARRIFSQRKAIVEPVFSSLRSQQGLNRFRRHGLQAVKREFALHVLAHNLSRAVALSRALFTLLYAVLRGLHEVAHRFLNRFLDLLVRAKAITSTPGLQLDAQQKRFATASSGRGGCQILGKNKAGLMPKRSEMARMWRVLISLFPFNNSATA